MIEDAPMKVYKLVAVFIMFVFLSIVGFLLAPVAIAQSAFAYAYLIVAEDGSTQLQIVSQTDVRSLPVVILNGRQAPFEAFASPSGQWVALPLLATNQRDFLIQILNPNSGEYRDVVQGLLAGRPVGFVGLDQNLVWSPDGRYLALNVASTGDQSRGDLDVLVYSLEDGRLTDLTSDQSDQFRVAWSPDTMKIATSTEDCSQPNQPCRLQLEVFNVSRQVRETSTDVSFLSRGSAVPGTSVCNLNWSPDGRYVSFISGCNSTVPQYPIEAYVWDTIENNVAQVTSFTVEAANRPQGAIIRGSYDAIWTNAQTLVVGAAVQINTDAVSTQTVAYTVPEISSTILSSMATRGWSLNPVSGQLAFQVIEEAPNITDVFQSSEPVRITPPDMSLSESLAATDAASIFTAQAGCDLSWSPDGSTLAFTIRADDNCRLSVERIVFLDAQPGATREHVIPTNIAIARIVPIGWVAG